MFYSKQKQKNIHRFKKGKKIQSYVLHRVALVPIVYLFCKHNHWSHKKYKYCIHVDG